MSKMLAESILFSASQFLRINRKIISKNFLISLLIHGLCAVLLFFYLLRSYTALKTEEIEVQIIQTQTKPKALDAESHSKQSVVRRSATKIHTNIPLSALGIKINTRSISTLQNSAQSLEEKTENSTESFNFEQNDKDLSLHQYVYETIDHGLTYPIELAEQRMNGSVQATIFFSADGEYIASKAQFDANSNYLKVVVSQALRRVFREPIPKSKLKELEAFSVRCAFTFEITEHNDTSIIASKKKILGDRLSFYRNYQKSALQWDLGPLHGLGPIPQVDVLWLPEKIGEIFSNKAKVDPLEKYRDDPSW